MAKKLLMAVLALMAMTMQAKVNVEVSETVELLSALSRTAGYPEYNMNMGSQYTQDLDNWFAPFKDHPIINYYQGLRENFSIAYNAPMDLAVNLVIDDGHLKFVGDKSCMDNRWAHVDIDGLVDLLNQFYTDTRFHEFYQQHQDFYQDILRQYEANVMQYFNQDWYPRFYGTEPGEVFRLILGFANGGNNYAAQRQFPGQPKENFSICSYWAHPQMGSILDPGNAKKYAAPTLIHEFNHSFVNYLQEIDKNAKLLGDIPNQLLNQNYDIMEQQAYPEGRIVFNESVVRAATILYMMENGYSPEEVRYELNDQLSCGFSWMPELVTALRDYNTHRNKYPTLNDFYPQIAKVLRQYLDTQQKRLAKPFALSKSLKKTDMNTASFASEVMESAELMGILCRIAGYEEYCEDNTTSYSKDIDQWFASFGQHPAVEYCQKLRSQRQIAYDAPMSLAMRLVIENGKVVKLQEEDGDTGLDDRWNSVNMQEFLALLNQFYADTRFHDFFQQHQSLYSDQLKVFNDKVMPHVHPEWFTNFIGSDINTRYKIVVCFANGMSSYGASRHLKGHPWDQINVIGQSTVSAAEKSPKEIADYLVDMFVQFSHHPLFDTESFTSEMNQLADQLYEMNLNQMQMNRIQDGKSAIAKSIAAAANFIHKMENGGNAEQMTQQLNNYSTVFSWMPELLTAIGEYANKRNKYQSISDFYPQIAKVLSQQLRDEQKRLDKALR